MTYTDPSFAHASIMEAIRKPIADILGTRTARIKARTQSEPHVRGAQTKARQRREKVMTKVEELRR